MAGLSQTDFDQMKAELDAEWTKASTRDEGLRVIVNFGQRFGYKNVMAALQNRVPKRFTQEMTVEQFKSWTPEEEAASKQ